MEEKRRRNNKMMKERMLPETGELVFRDGIDELIDFTKELQARDAWKRLETRDVKVTPLDDIPILLDCVRDELSLTGYDDDVIRECMENEGCVLTLPLSEGGNIPIRYTAIRGIRDRAGINGPVFAKLSRYENADILNTALKHWGNQCLVLLRDQKITAVHSGDENDYAVLPQGDLFEAFRDGLREMFGETNTFFKGGFVSHELSGCDIEIEGGASSKAFQKALSEIGESSDVELITQLRVSDIATNGANIYPMIKSGDEYLQAGNALKLTHKNRHTISDFKQNVAQIMSLYRDGADKMNELASTAIRHPVGCLRAVAKKLGIPRKYIQSTGSDTGIADLLYMHGADESSAFEIYYYLCKVISMMRESGAINKEIFNMQENISRALYLNWVEYDTETDW